MVVESSISLNKFISDTGYCSRREADKLMEQGRVLLNDKPAKPGARYQPGDQVEVDGSLIKTAKVDKKIYLAFNKPVGITTTAESAVKGNIIDYINFPKRIFPIGRLDKDSEGLILLTNDGDVVNKILRAGNSHDKEYIVRVNKPITAAFLKNMREGVAILDTVTMPCEVIPINRHVFKILLKQGLNRQIRRMCEALGYKVETLQRTRIMHIELAHLAVGKWRYLSAVELDKLMAAIQHSSKTAEASTIATSTISAVKEKRNAKPFPKDKGKAASPVRTKEVTDKEKSAESKRKSHSYKSFKERGKKR